jgi:predicted small lipoprotein YifL
MSVRKALQLPVFMATIALVSSLLGCGKGGPTLIPVTGSIEVDGKPANGATIIFHPTDKEMKLIPATTTDANGKFTLVTNAKPGIPVGSYDVTITWPDPAVQPTAAEKLQGLAEPGPDLLAGKYAKKGASGLKADVTSSTKDLPPFKLMK